MHLRLPLHRVARFAMPRLVSTWHWHCTPGWSGALATVWRACNGLARLQRSGAHASGLSASSCFKAHHLHCKLHEAVDVSITATGQLVAAASACVRALCVGLVCGVPCTLPASALHDAATGGARWMNHWAICGWWLHSGRACPACVAGYSRPQVALGTL
jgi:hypothetical protein